MSANLTPEQQLELAAHKWSHETFFEKDIRAIGGYLAGYHSRDEQVERLLAAIKSAVRALQSSRWADARQVLDAALSGAVAPKRDLRSCVALGNEIGEQCVDVVDCTTNGCALRRAPLQITDYEVRRATIEECAKVADGFTCGVCGMDGKASSAIRALLAVPASTKSKENK